MKDFVSIPENHKPVDTSLDLEKFNKPSQVDSDAFLSLKVFSLFHGNLEGMSNEAQA